MKVRVHVSLKPGVLDPQGRAIQHSLEGLGFTGVSDVRAGRLIELEVDDPVVQFLSDAGYDPVYGARPLKRAIQKELETELGRALLAGKVREGTRVRAVMEGRRIQFS